MQACQHDTVGVRVHLHAHVLHVRSQIIRCTDQSRPPRAGHRAALPMPQNQHNNLNISRRPWRAPAQSIANYAHRDILKIKQFSNFPAGHGPALLQLHRQLRARGPARHCVCAHPQARAHDGARPAHARGGGRHALQVPPGLYAFLFCAFEAYVNLVMHVAVDSTPCKSPQVRACACMAVCVCVWVWVGVEMCWYMAVNLQRQGAGPVPATAVQGIAHIFPPALL